MAKASNKTTTASKTAEGPKDTVQKGGPIKGGVDLQDIVFFITFGHPSMDHVKKMFPRLKSTVTADEQKGFGQLDPGNRVYGLSQLAAVQRPQREAVAMHLKALPTNQVEKVNDAELAAALKGALTDYVDLHNEADMAKVSTAAAEADAKKKGMTAEQAAAAAKSKADREAAAAKAKEEKEAKKAAEKTAREAAAAAKKAEKEAAAAKAKAEKEAATKQAAEERARKEAELASFGQSFDESIARTEATANEAAEALKKLKAERAEAIKAKAAELGLNVKVSGGTGTGASVPKSTAVVLSEPLEVFGQTFPSGHVLKVKDIHLAAWRVSPKKEGRPAKKDVVEVIKQHFPSGSTTERDVTWHWGMLEKGKMDPTSGKRIG